MKNLKYLLTVFCFVVMATTLVSCKATSVVPPATTETTVLKTVTVTEHDTILKTEKDSSYYKAYLECVNNKVVFKPGTATESKAGNHVAAPQVKISDNLLMVDCVAAAQTLFFEWKERYTQENKATVQRIPYAVPAQLSWWQTAQIWCGRVFLSLLLIIAIIIGLRAIKVI